MSSTQSGSHLGSVTADLPVPGALLIFSVATPQFRCVPLALGTTLVLGRDDIGGAALPDQRVSRQHAELSFNGAQFTIKDLDSRNGTWLDRTKVSGTTRAAPGSVLRIADSIFLLCEDLKQFQAGTVSAGEVVIGPRYRAALDEIELGARGGSSVLVSGENGSGKELAARRFHDAVSRSGPFVAVNCAAIVGSLAESLIFGQVKDSSTNARETKGYVREANGGTLFLDELGELDPKIQAKLLRVVEHQEVMPVGASTYTPVKVRFVSATNRDLRAALGAGFREDLFHRLAQFEVKLPPLRERREEIPWLIAHTLVDPPGHPSLVECALLREWPGNVRELCSQMKKAGAIARAQQSTTVRDSHLDDAAGMKTGAHVAFAPAGKPTNETMPAGPGAMAATSFTSRQVQAALELNGWNIAAALRTLGIPNRTTLTRLIKKYGLTRPADAPPEEDEPGEA